MGTASEFKYKSRLKSLESHRRGWTEPLVNTMTVTYLTIPSIVCGSSLLTECHAAAKVHRLHEPERPLFPLCFVLKLEIKLS